MSFEQHVKDFWSYIFTLVKQKCILFPYVTLREKRRSKKLFLVRIFLHSVRIQEIRTRNNYVFGHFSHSVRTVLGKRIEVSVHRLLGFGS